MIIGGAVHTDLDTNLKWGIALSVLALVGAISGCTHQNTDVKRLECEARMRRIGGAIDRYIARHQDIPRDSVGRFAIGPLICNGANNGDCIPALDSRCPLADMGDSCYVTSPLIDLRDFRDRKRAANVIVMTHDMNCLHVGGSHGREFVLILLADGHVYGTIQVDRERYSEWLRRYREGAPGSTDFRKCVEMFHFIENGESGE